MGRDADRPPGDANICFRQNLKNIKRTKLGKFRSVGGGVSLGRSSRSATELTPKVVSKLF